MHKEHADTVTKSYQPSMTEWFAAIGELEESNLFRQEDNTKMDRLEILRQTIGTPYRQPVVFALADALDPTTEFLEVLTARADESVAFRLVPKSPELPKYRNRGLTMRDCYELWLKTLTIKPEDYKLEIFPNERLIHWSTIFVIQDGVAYGEIIRGGHSQLTQGETKNEARQFWTDFANWRWSVPDPEAELQMKRALATLLAPTDKQAELTDKLNVTFSNGHINGYFETVVPPDMNVYFIDYNRVLPKYLPALNRPQPTAEDGTLRGAIAYPGIITGRAVLVPPDQIDTVMFNDGDILVCDNTDVRYLPLMKKAGAIVTNRGGILSHAAIIARELKKPCLIGTKTATKTLVTGNQITVLANEGRVEILRG